MLVLLSINKPLDIPSLPLHSSLLICPSTPIERDIDDTFAPPFMHLTEKRTLTCCSLASNLSNPPKRTDSPGRKNSQPNNQYPRRKKTPINAPISIQQPENMVNPSYNNSMLRNPIFPLRMHSDPKRIKCLRGRRSWSTCQRLEGLDHHALL